MNKEAIPPTSNHRPSQARRVCTSPEQQPHTGRLPSQTAQRIRDSMVSVSQKIARIEAGLAPFEDLGQGVQDALQQLFGDDLTARDMMMVEGIIRDFSRLLLGEYERHREKEVTVQHEKHDAEGKLIILAIKQSKEPD